MPKARARLDPTTSMTVAPTTASTICVWMTGADRAGVPRRRGRKASAAPRAVATGSASTARSTMSKCDSSTCGSDCANSGGGGCIVGRVGRGASARRLVDRSCSKRKRVVDLLLEPVDEALCVTVRVIGCAKRIVPLLVGEARHVLGGPSHIGRANHRKQFLVASHVIEFDSVAGDRGDESVPLETVEAVPFRIQLAGLTERGAEI